MAQTDPALQPRAPLCEGHMRQPAGSSAVHPNAKCLAWLCKRACSALPATGSHAAGRCSLCLLASLLQKAGTAHYMPSNVQLSSSPSSSAMHSSLCTPTCTVCVPMAGHDPAAHPPPHAHIHGPATTRLAHGSCCMRSVPTVTPNNHKLHATAKAACSSCTCRCWETGSARPSIPAHRVCC